MGQPVIESAELTPDVKGLILAFDNKVLVPGKEPWRPGPLAGDAHVIRKVRWGFERPRAKADCTLDHDRTKELTLLNVTRPNYYPFTELASPDK